MEDEFKRLHNYIRKNEPQNAKNFFLDMANTFKKELHETFLDEYILNSFDESHGLIAFITVTVSLTGYSDAITECLEILYIFVNTFTEKILKYTPLIRGVCLQILLTNRSSNKDKRRALELLGLIFEKSDYYPNNFHGVEDLYQTLYNRYEIETQPTLVAQIIKAITILIKKHHDKIGNTHSLYHSMLRFLENSTNKSKAQEVAGRFGFFNDYLDINAEYDIRKIYDCIKKRVNIECYEKTAHIAALNLLRKHVRLFIEEIYKDLNWWQDVLNRHLDGRGELQKIAYLTLDVFYENIAEVISLKNYQEVNLICLEYLNKFTMEINDENNHGYKLKLAIKGFGHFAKCFKYHLPLEDATKVFVDIILKIEKVYLLDFNPNSGHLDYLPDYIQALSNIVQVLENISDYEIGILQKATILLIKLFPRLSNHHHNLVVNPILIAYCHIRKSKKDATKPFLRSIVVEGMIFSCSQSLAYDLIDNSDLPTYKDYLKLWTNLLNKNEREFEKWSIPQDDAKNILKELFDEVMATLFELVSKLNLETQKRDENVTRTDPQLSLQAVKVNDFNIFINLVDLYVDLLDTIPNHRFLKWAQFYLTFNINKSIKHPLVSGFYKLIAVGLNITNRVNYFSEERLQSEDIKDTFDNIANFINSVMTKINLYKEDLKLSCIKVILAAPIVYIAKHLRNITPIMVSLFTLARSNLSLAKTGIETLESWHQLLPQNEIEEFLKTILPTLDSYLSSKSLSETFDAQMLNNRKTKQALNKRRIVTVAEGDLLQVQKKILSFLGNLSADVCMALVEGNNSIPPNFIGQSALLKVDLVYNNLSIPFYMERFIPRVIELALYCSERKLQITACETLHAIVLILLGTSKIDESKDMDKLLKTVFYPLLQLGCYPDNTVQQIIQPLVEQLVHWYATPSQQKSKKLAIVVESLMDAVTQTEDTALRDFSCVCIHEFIKYTLKNVTGNNIEDEILNVKLIIRKLKQFSYHSDPAKRFAAALIFNNIYTLLREERHIVDTYWLELFQFLMYNLSQVEENDEFDCLSQIIQGIDHIERVFVEKSDLFNRTSKKRRVPIGLSGSTLDCVISAALSYRSTRNLQARARLYEFYYKLSSCALNQNQYITYISYPDLTTPDFDKQLSAGAVINWMKNFLFALDTELSIYNHEKRKHTYLKDPNLFQSLRLYLTNVEPHTIQTFNNVYNSIITKPSDQENFKNLKVEITKYAVMYLVIALYYEDQQEVHEILKEQGFPLLCEFVFSKINFINDKKHEEILYNLFSKMKGFDDVVKKFKATLHAYVAKYYLFEYELDKNIPLKQRQLLRGLMIVKKSKIKNNINIDIYLNSILNNMLKKIVYEKDGLTYALKMSQSAKKYCDLLIDLYLENNNFEVFIEHLCNQKQVIILERNETLSFGKYIYSLFKATILQQIFKNFTKFFGAISGVSEEDNYFFTKEILNYITSNRKKLEATLITDVVQLILDEWIVFSRFYEDDFDNKTTGLQLIEKISNLSSSLVLSTGHVGDWILTCFNFKHYRILPQRIYQHITNIFNALPILLGRDDIHLTQLWSELDIIQGAYFTDIKDSQQMHTSATLVINKAFQTAITAKSSKFFLFCCNIYVTSHLKKNINTEEYCKLFMMNSSEIDLLRDIYEMAINLTKLPLAESYQLAESILVSLLRHVNYDIFEMFFVEIIKDLMIYLNNEDDNDEVIVRKLVGYILLKSLFSRINVDNFDDKTCPITKACHDNVQTGRELLRSATKVTSSYLKEPIDESLPPEKKEYLRLCKCQCYNALISIISNSITAETTGNESYYNLLFNREANSENLLWRNIVDTSKNYAFPLVFDKLPDKTKVLVNIRTLHQENNDHINTLNYIESQNIFNSSLKEDICQYDFSRTIVRSQAGDYIPNKPQVEMEISIDAEEIDSHECMANICGLIRKIHSERIYKDTESPKWAELINRELQNDNVPLNVKLFLLKIIEKEQEIFKPFANVFIESIIELITNNKIGEGINYFVGDLVVMLSTWTEIAKEPPNVSNLLQFLIENVNRERADVRKYHLNLVKLIVESWRNCITVPINYLFSKMENLRESKKVDIIIHFMSIFIANELPPWDKDTLKKFAKKIVELLDSTTSTIVMQVCAETIGMSLKYLVKHDQQNAKNFEEFVIKALKKFDISKRLNCLQSMMKHYSKICNPFLNTLIHELKKSQIKGFCLKIFVECITALHECSDIQALDLRSLTNDHDDHLKTLGMEIIRKTIPCMQIVGLRNIPGVKLRLSMNDFKLLLEDLSKFTASDNHVIRNIMYEIFIDVYNIDNLSDNEEIKNKCIDVLLQGLTDQNDEIHEKITNFWMRRIPPDISARFHYVLKNMYNPNLEEYFLSYAINFLLKDLDVSGKLFRKPLLDKDFSYQDIKDNWRMRHSSYAPLFASTYRSQELFSDLNSYSGTSNELIRASEDMEFEPTLNPGSLAYDTQELLSRSIETSEETVDGEFKVPLPVTNKIYKQRFRKDISRVDREFAIRQIDRKVQLEQKRQDSVKQRQQGASIYRRYRVGEIPDIEISLSDVLLPLKKLIQNDAQLAQIFFTSFFGEMLSKGKKEFSDTYLSDISLAINHIFKNSVIYNTYFMGALLDVAIKNKDAVSFSPSIISKVCLNSGLLSSGIMLLEEYLISNFEYEVPAKRSTNLSDNSELNCWVKLADLYRELQDWDIVRAIFLSKMNSNESVIKAIDAESQGFWKNACELYSQVIRNDTCLETKDFYYESYYKCFAELSDWDGVTKSIKATTSSGHFWDDLWDQDWNQAKLLPWYITAELRNSLYDEQRMNELTSLLNSAMIDSTKANYIKIHFSEEIAFLYLINDNIDKSLFFVQNNLERFLENWQNTSPMLTFLRTNRLIKIRNTIDLFNFINKVNICDEDTLLKNANDLCTQWLKVSKENLSSIMPLETRNIYRGECLGTLKTKIDLETKWDQVKFVLDMQLVDVALQMHNFNIARKYCQNNSKYQGTENSDCIRYTLNYSKLLLLKASLMTSDPNGKISLFLKAYESARECLDSPTAEGNVELTLSSATIMYDISLNLSDTVKESRADLDAERIEILGDFVSGYSDKGIDQHAVEEFSYSLNMCRNSPSIRNSAVLSEIGNAYVKLAHYARQSGDSPEQLITFVLRSMYYGSSEGRQIFPCLLDIEGIGTVHKNTFHTECANLPEWLFIQWIPQLLSKLDSSCVFVIDTIVLKLAAAYPQSIMYAYKLSKEKFNINIEDEKVKKHLKSTLVELDNLLSNTAADNVIGALSSVATAGNLLHYHITQLAHACHRSDGGMFKKAFDDLESFCKEVDYDDTASKIGAVHKRVRELSKDLLKLNNVTFEPIKILQLLSKASKKIKDSEDAPNNKTARYTSRLSYYCPYLENFMDNQPNYNVDLEIPGQYVGDHKPLLQYHTKISGFSSEVSIKQSLRKPIKITIFGNDGKDHEFLVKVGEDLRQDQRIEQIFGLMNDIFNSNATCREHRLKISTYQVIPLTCTLGLIHWVRNTEDLRVFLGKTVPAYKQKFAAITKRFQSLYTGCSEPGKDHYDKALKKDSLKVMSIYGQLVNQLPFDIFRQALQTLCPNSETFITLRNNFMTSFICSCIANWILGIGDRHLGNTLICLDNARTIDIDFGHAFGSGVQIQSIPELLPFRLTPHIINLMQPMQEHGLIEETMIHVLRALRENHKSLISTVRVFMNEPSMDWLQYKKFENNALGYNWDPEEKIRHTEMKLTGSNPVDIMVVELKNRTRDSQEIIKKLIEYVRGNERDNIRGRLHGSLSVEHQVKCLLDHATDSNLLCRMHHVWETWI